MFYSKTWKTLSVSIALIWLMLISAIAASNIVTVKSQPSPYFTLYATVTSNPYWGYYGGYHAIWEAIKPELASIGIDLQIRYYDDYTWYDRRWEGGWEKPWVEGGWDLAITEWWLQPHAIEPWFSSMVLGDLTPPQGFNAFPWKNDKADTLLHKALSEPDAVKRRDYIWDWQEMYMADAPGIGLYHPATYEIQGNYFSGYDPTGSWFYDTRYMTLTPGAMPPQRAAATDTLIYAVSESVWNLNPMFMDTYTEEQMTALQFCTLYAWSLTEAGYNKIDNGQMPDFADYFIRAELADGDPQYASDGMSAVVNLRQGVTWSNGHPFNATDVVFTFETCVLDIRALNSGYGDIAHIVDRVEKVNNTAVEFFFKEPYTPPVEFKSILANDWGLDIIPYSTLKQYEGDPAGIRSDPSTSPSSGVGLLPALGPFKLTYVETGVEVRLENNTSYFGYDKNLLKPTERINGGRWGPNGINEVILKWIPDAATRLVALQTFEADAGEYPTAPVQVFQDMIANPGSWPYHKVWLYDYPASNPIWLNLNNPYLANLYVRQAIAHAIPYDKIINDILPGWGIEPANTTRAKSLIIPQNWYTDDNNVTVHLYNEDLPPYEYNITRAQEFMDMWIESRPGEGLNGPIGDADQSRLVTFDDWWTWLQESPPVTGPWPRDIYPEWPFLIDPDWDNDDDVDIDDSIAWSNNYGTTYP